MINEYTQKDLSAVLNVVNHAALKYKGIIPDDCWHEPYMLEHELIREFCDGVRMFGYHMNNTLVGVMGIQEMEDVTLIRHAYTLPNYQRIGIGQCLLQHLFQINKNPRLLVGTWQNATWAIRFYVKNDFLLHKRKQINQLLTLYWKIPVKQMKNSVVLEKQMV